MCGRFAQSQTCEEYLAYLAEEAERDIAYVPEPIGRYNAAPGTKVLLLSERDEQLHLDPVHWGYSQEWWDKPPLINAWVDTPATSKMFKPLGSTVEQSVSLTVGLNGKRKPTRSSPISYTVKTASPSSWRLPAAYLSSAGMNLRFF